MLWIHKLRRAMRLFYATYVSARRRATVPAPEPDPEPQPGASAPLRVMTWTEDDANQRFPTAECPDLVSDCTTSKVHLADDGERIWFDSFPHTDLWEFDKCIDPGTGLPTPYRYLRPHTGIEAMKQHTLDAIATWQAQGLSRIDYISDDAETRWLSAKITNAWQQALVADTRWPELQAEYDAELRKQTGDPTAVFYFGQFQPEGYEWADYEDDVHDAVFWGEVNRALRIAKKEPVNEWCGRASDHADGRHYVGHGNYENGGQPMRYDLMPSVDRTTGWVYAKKQPMNRMEGIDPALTTYGNRLEMLDGIGPMADDDAGGSAWHLALADFRQIGAARSGSELDPYNPGIGLGPGGATEIAVSPWFAWSGCKHKISKRRYRSVPDPETEVDSPHLVNPYWKEHVCGLLLASGQYEGRRTPPRYFNSRTAFETGNSNDFCDREAQAIIAAHRALIGDALPVHPVRTGEFADWFAGANGRIATLTHACALGLRDATGRAHYRVMIERKNAPMIPSQAAIDAWPEATVNVLRSGAVIGTLTIPAGAAGAAGAYYSDPEVSAVDLTFEVSTHETAPDLVPLGIKDLSLWEEADGNKPYTATTATAHPTGGTAQIYRAPSSGGARTVTSPPITLTGATPGEIAIAHIYLESIGETRNIAFDVLDSAGVVLATSNEKPIVGSMSSRFIRFIVPADLVVRLRKTCYRNYASDPMIFRQLTTPALPE